MSEWRRESKYHETNGRYTVAAVKVLKLEETTIGADHKQATGKKGEFPNIGGQLHWAFEAWRNGKPATLIGAYDTAAEARQRCEDDGRTTE